jgi:hypothetical protein
MGYQWCWASQQKVPRRKLHRHHLAVAHYRGRHPTDYRWCWASQQKVPRHFLGVAHCRGRHLMGYRWCWASLLSAQEHFGLTCLKETNRNLEEPAMGPKKKKKGFFVAN